MGTTPHKVSQQPAARLCPTSGFPFLLQIISFHSNLPHLKIFLGFSSLISQPGVEKQSNSPYISTSAVTVKIWKFIALPMAKHSSLLTHPSGNLVHIKNPHPLDWRILIGAIYTAQICMILRATSRRWMSQLTEAILFLQEFNYVRWPREQISQPIFTTTCLGLSVLGAGLDITSASSPKYKRLPAKLLGIKTWNGRPPRRHKEG